MVERKFNDEDVHDDIVVIDDTLARFMTTLTSFSKYQTEIMTGRLQWSPVHSEKFWRENADRFEDDGFLLIRRLIELLDSEDELTVEVACYDLGEFARFHPDGRKVVDKLGAKRKLMAKMAHKQSKSKNPRWAFFFVVARVADASLCARSCQDGAALRAEAHGAELGVADGGQVSDLPQCVGACDRESGTAQLQYMLAT